MRKTIFCLTVAASFALMPMTVMAHGHGRGCHGAGYRQEATVCSLCNVEGCHETGVHQHGHAYYYGHSIGDGHDYHEACNVEGCTETAAHEHDGRICLPCNGDCAGYYGNSYHHSW